MMKTKFIAIITFTFYSINILSGQSNVGIGTISPEPSAKLEIQSTSQGLLPPRMTAAQRNAIDSPVAGLIIWCVNCGTYGELQVYNGLEWTNIIGESSSLIPFASTQVGDDIDGEAPQDYFGTSVSLTPDGMRFVAGAALNDANGMTSGHARIFEWVNSTWTQVGADIDGEAIYDASGSSVAISSDGTRVVIGAIGNDEGGSDSGHVRVFGWDGVAWTQVGGDINGDDPGGHFGHSVSISADGNRIAAGSPYSHSVVGEVGQVRIFDWDGSAWVQVGNTIDGEAHGDRNGFSISMTPDGDKLVIGADHNAGGGFSRGHARFFELNNNAWIQVGSDIDGEADQDYSGNSVSLSVNGNRIAVAAESNDGNGLNAGHVRIYELTGDSWLQLGSDLDGEFQGDKFGSSVSLTGDGKRIAIGAIWNGITAGHVRIFDWVNNEWTQIGPDIDGENDGDKSGSAVSFSADGSRVAIAAEENGGNGILSGHVRVYH
jgi:hypothetical protein